MPAPDRPPSPPRQVLLGLAALALTAAGCNCAPPALTGNPELPDAGPGLACGACQADAQCDAVARCVPVTGGKACVPRCDPKKSACPTGFTCAVPPEGGAAACLPEGGTCCIDHDGDGYGRGVNCAGPDCDDNDREVHPGATEVCDLVDDNCDGQIDEGFGPASCGVGACARTVQTCELGLLQTCVPGPPTPEICNGVDDDCNGLVDDGDPAGGVACPTGLPGVCAQGASACSGGALSCRVIVMPGTYREVCNNLDDDCDGQIDDAPAAQLCPLTPAVQTTACATGACHIATCAPGAYDVDGQYQDGCECLDDPAPATCSAAGALTLAAGGTVTQAGKVPAPGASDWVQVTLPAVAVGSPFHLLVDFTVNDAQDFRFEVISAGSCAGSPDCAAAGGLTAWEVDYSGYVAGAGCCTDDVARPTALLVRVFRASAAASCGNYTLRVRSL